MFDPSTLSDDALFEKEAELHRRIVYAARFGSDAIIPLQDMLNKIEAVRQDRFARFAFDTLTSRFPDVIETDPISMAAAGKSSEAEKKKSAPEARPTPVTRVQRSSTPIIAPNKD